MRVRDIMTKKVFTLHPDHKVNIANEIMHWAEVRHVPIVELNDLVVGIISRTDMLRAALPQMDCEDAGHEERQHLANIKARDIMNPAVCIDQDATVQAAAKLMCSGKRNCLPVVDAQQKLLGIVTSHDLLSLIERLTLPDETPARPPQATRLRR